MKAESALRWVAAAASILLLAWLLAHAGKGIDFTDEGYYLNWMAHPFDYPASLSQFGFIYHPLYRLLDGDIALLRQANMLLLWLLGTALAYVLLRDARLAVAAGASSLWFLYNWLPTPSYNSLNLQALLLAATGLYLIPHRGQIGWLLLALGGWLTFMAKPSSAAALAILAVLFLLLTRQWKWRDVSMALLTATGLLLLSAWMIDGSLAGFIARLRDGLDDAALMKIHPHAWLRLQPWLWHGRVFIVSLCCIPWWRLSRQQAVVVLSLLSLPFIYSVGSGNSAWSMSLMAGGFWMLAVAYALSVAAPRLLLAFVCCAEIANIMFLVTAMAHPYRQAPLHEATVPVKIAGSSLVVAQNAAETLKQVTDAAHAAGLHPGDALIDMTGRSPLLVYALEARAPGLAWTLGGYPGSAGLLAKKLEGMPCDMLSRAWFLLEPDGARAIDQHILAERGMILRQAAQAGPFLLEQPVAYRAACEVHHG